MPLILRAALANLNLGTLLVFWQKKADYVGHLIIKITTGCDLSVRENSGHNFYLLSVDFHAGPCELVTTYFSKAKSVKLLMPILNF